MRSIHLVYLVIAFTLNAVANVLLKIGAQKGLSYKGLGFAEMIVQNVWPLLGVLLFALNVIFYFLALREIPLSTAYPTMVIMSFLIINSVAYFYLAEPINGFQWLGYGFMLIGLFFVFYFTVPDSL